MKILRVMNYLKDHWIICEEISLKQREQLVILATAAGFDVTDVPYIGIASRLIDMEYSAIKLIRHSTITICTKNQGSVYTHVTYDEVIQGIIKIIKANEKE